MFRRRKSEDDYDAEFKQNQEELARQAFAKEQEKKARKQRLKDLKEGK